MTPSLESTPCHWPSSPSPPSCLTVSVSVGGKDARLKLPSAKTLNDGAPGRGDKPVHPSNLTARSAASLRQRRGYRRHLDTYGIAERGGHARSADLHAYRNMHAYLTARRVWADERSATVTWACLCLMVAASACPAERIAGRQWSLPRRTRRTLTKTEATECPPPESPVHIMTLRWRTSLARSEESSG